MITTDEAVKALLEMGEHADAGRDAEAVTAAEQIVRLAPEVGNARQRGILVATATSTWLTSKAVLDPSDTTLISRCDRTFEQFSKLTFEQAGITAIIALGVKIQLLLQSGQQQEAEQAAGDLAAFFCARPAGETLAQQAGEVVRIASNMVAMRAPVSAAQLAGTVVDRLAGSANPEEALLAATAQAWVIIASIYGEPIPGLPVVRNPEELRSFLDADDDPPGQKQGAQVTNRLIAMGETALGAVETLMQRLRDYGSDWDDPRMMLSTIKVATLDDLGRDDECRAAKQAFVDEFSGSDGCLVDGVAQAYQRDLQQP